MFIDRTTECNINFRQHVKAMPKIEKDEFFFSLHKKKFSFFHINCFPSISLNQLVVDQKFTRMKGYKVSMKETFLSFNIHDPKKNIYKLYELMKSF